MKASTGKFVYFLRWGADKLIHSCEIPFTLEEEPSPTRWALRAKAGWRPWTKSVGLEPICDPSISMHKCVPVGTYLCIDTFWVKGRFGA